MAIPTNLIPLTVTNVTNLEETPVTENIVASISSINGVPSNLVPINTSDIANTFQSVAGQVPNVNAPEISNFSVLSQVIPDRIFESGSYDTMRNRALSGVGTFVNGLPQPRIIEGLPTSIPAPPSLPSFSQFKDYIETKIDRIKQQRQRASARAVKERLKKKDNPFTYRQELINIAQKSNLTRTI